MSKLAALRDLMMLMRTAVGGDQDHVLNVLSDRLLKTWAGRYGYQFFSNSFNLRIKFTLPCEVAAIPNALEDLGLRREGGSIYPTPTTLEDDIQAGIISSAESLHISGMGSGTYSR